MGPKRDQQLHVGVTWQVSPQPTIRDLQIGHLLKVQVCPIPSTNPPPESGMSDVRGDRSHQEGTNIVPLFGDLDASPTGSLEELMLNEGIQRLLVDSLVWAGLRVFF